MVKVFIIIGIIILSIVIFIFIIHLLFILTMKNTIKRNNFRLDVFIQNQSDIFSGIDLVLQKQQIESGIIKEAVFPIFAISNSNMNVKKVQINKFNQARTHLSELMINQRLAQDLEFISLKSNLDDVCGSFTTFCVQYNREVNLFNRHIKMISGRVIAFLLRMKPKELI